ncbi:MAG: precorrin-8X methylmutase [Coriobacteriales bacterium]|nr:precorrin-8X methylmutase [Coriobacteriales bacterium]
MRRGIELLGPRDIEAASFAIIQDELEVPVEPSVRPVVERVIHATADFDFAHTLVFSDAAVERGVAALASGATVVADTTMVAAGINKRVLGGFGGSVRTFIGDADVAEEARRRGITRSAVSMERACGLSGPLIFAIGNAPTALVRLCELVEEGAMAPPELVVGVPVGFVNVVESKELLLSSGLTSIVARGRKGGSTVAVAICNALLYLASHDRRE